ncbi:MAG: glycine--tRNA ligase subunit beta, partial [bacterium]
MSGGRSPKDGRPKRADLLFEIGTEEIPARFLPSLRRQLAVLAERELRNHEALDPGAITTFATPRRLVLLARGMADRQVDRTVTQPGPFKSQGYDVQGRPTPAAEGFARKHGVGVADLKEIPDPKGPRLAYVVALKGKAAREVLPAALERVLRGLEFPKSMRWPGSPAPFARPVRWLLALLGSTPLTLAWGRVAAGKTTRGRRFFHPRPLPVASAAAYAGVLKRAGIVLDVQERRALIQRQAEALAAKAGGRVLWNQELLDEVADLVEAPVAVLGSFPADALEVPQPVLVASMEEHQRYFPVAGKDGRLLPKFVTIANGVATAHVTAGNERVLKARLADARFFFTEDRKHGLEVHGRRLDGVVWQANAGSMADKARRLEALAHWIAARVGAREGVACRAAELAKADLVTHMVGEFPMLQGITGGLYAAADGEPAGVAEAIRDHYKPAGPGDDVPATPEGCVVALADKLDQLAGHFALGHAPSGAADPYGLRRAAVGVVRILTEQAWHVGLREVFALAANMFISGLQVTVEAQGFARAFIRGRVATILEEQG